MDQFILKQGSFRLSTSMAYSSGATLGQQVWKRSSPNMSPFLVMGWAQLSAKIDEIAFVGTNTDTLFSFVLKYTGGIGSNARFGDGAKTVDLDIENCVTSVVVEVSHPNLVEVVPFSSVDALCTDSRCFAVFVKEGVPINQYDYLGTIKMTATLEPGSFSDNPSNTFVTPTLCLYAAETYSGIPPVVSGITAQALYGPRRVQLNWQDVGGETSYKVQRQLNGGAWSDLVTPAANQTSYVDTTVVAGVYRYQIRSVNSNGYSAYVISSTCGVS